MDKNTFVVIMAGGIGSRFWPYSRDKRPKQFLDVLGTGKSLIRMTWERFSGFCPIENIFVVTNEGYGDLVKEQIPEITEDQVLLEPIRRNTAPCVAYACYKIAQKNPDAVVVIAPSDHAIFKEEAFIRVITSATQAASEGEKLITLGITPTRPETGYGYIQFREGQHGDIKKVKTFTEKPELSLAEKFIESGDFVWNAGLFVWHVKAIKKAFEKYLPEMDELFTEGQAYYYTSGETGFINSAYTQCKNISIDYGIMEKANNVYVIFGEFGWSDLGSWASLHEIKPKDRSQNVVDGNVMLYGTSNSLIQGGKDKLIVVQGLDGYLVTECDNVILICKIDDERQFREFVNDVKSKKGSEFI
jgi:mannose-1-phosphate guanylyltransferase